MHLRASLHHLPWRIWLKACADSRRSNHADLYPKIRQNSRAYYFEGIKLCCLIVKINTRFQPDAPYPDEIATFRASTAFLGAELVGPLARGNPVKAKLREFQTNDP